MFNLSAIFGAETRRQAEKYIRNCELRISELDEIRRISAKNPILADASVFTHCAGMTSIQQIRRDCALMDVALIDAGFDQDVLSLYQRSLAAIAALSRASANNLQEAVALAKKRGAGK